MKHGLRHHALPVGVAVLLLMAMGLVGSFTIDDAWIGARIARNLLTSHQWAFNVGTPSDAMTSPVWILPNLLGEWLHRAGLKNITGITVCKLLGALSAAVAGALVVRRGLTHGTFAGVATSLLLLCQSTLWIWPGAGLETGVAMLAFTGCAVGRPNRLRTFLFALIPWLRPELVAASLVLAALGDPSRRRDTLSAIALGCASVAIFRLAMFGHVLPLAAWAKPTDVGQGLRYAITGSIFVTWGIGAWLVHRSARVAGLALAGALLTHLLLVALAGGDWMPGWRLLAPVLPLYALSAALGLDNVRTHSTATGTGVANHGRGLSTGILVLLCSMGALDIAAQLPSILGDAKHRPQAQVLVASWGKHAKCIATVDVGWIGYATSARIVDLGGITDEQIAHLPGRHLDKHLTAAIGHDCEQAILHSATRPRIVDGELSSYRGWPVEHRWLHQHQALKWTEITEHAPGYFYVLGVRE